MNAQVRSRTRPRPGRHRRRPVVWPLLAAVVVGAVAASVVTAVRSAEPPCALPATAVTTDAATAPALRAALGAATAAGRLPGCADVRVAVRDAVDVLAGGGPDAGLWLPDSSLWTARVGGAATVLGSVASSPVVVAGRTGAAAPVALGDVLAARTPTGLVAPDRDTAGLLTMLAAATATAGPELAPTPQLAGAVVALDRRPLGSADAGFAQLDADGAPFLTTALAAVQHSARAGRRTVAAPVTGVPPADYPLVAVGEVPAARSLLDALLGPEAQDALRRAGLAAPQAVDPPDPDRVRRVLALWTTLRVDSTLLAVIDVSGSMEEVVDGRTRIDLAADAARQGLALFPPDYEVGLWTFSARPEPEPDFDVVVPVGPLDAALPDGTRRADALGAGADALRALPGRGTALHRTILEAVRAVRTDFRPGREHTVVLLTDGRDEDDAGIGLDELVATLRAEADAARPVPVIPVGVGPEVDLDGLRAVAEATGGRAYQALDPAQMREVFLDALLLRVCRPDC